MPTTVIHAPLLQGESVIGTSDTPTTVDTTYTVQSDWTDSSIAGQVSWFIDVDTTTGPPTTLSVQVEWSPDGGSTAFLQGTESISSGTSTVSPYEAQFALSGSAQQLSPMALPVIAPLVRIKAKVDTGTADLHISCVTQKF
jgi:hypothetical protein